MMISILKLNKRRYCLLLKGGNKKNDNFMMKMNDYHIFGTENSLNEIKQLSKNSTTLNDMGFVVNVGTVVWNQRKIFLLILAKLDLSTIAI